MKRIIASKRVSSVGELQAALTSMMFQINVEIVNLDYVLELVQETLTDGSKVYDVQFRAL